MSKKLIVNCNTKEEVCIDLTSEEETQLATDRQEASISEAEYNVKSERDKKINAEMIKIATDNLVSRDEL